MNNKRMIKKDILFAVIFIIIGAAAGITGFIFEYQQGMMAGLTIGFLPTGTGMLIMYRYAMKKPELMKNIELEKEERNQYINTKAGYHAFWITYWYIFIAVILHHIIEIPSLTFLIITLCFLPVIYFTLVIIFHRKY